jgi:hypothetical protein
METQEVVIRLPRHIAQRLLGKVVLTPSTQPIGEVQWWDNSEKRLTFRRFMDALGYGWSDEE